MRNEAGRGFIVNKSPPASKISDASKSALYFVEEQEEIMSFSQCRSCFKKLLRGDMDPALSLNRLEKNGHCVGVDSGLECAWVVVGKM